MNPFFAITVVTLNPFTSHLFHAHGAILIVFEIFVAFEAEYVLVFDNVLLVLEAVGAHLTLEA